MNLCSLQTLVWRSALIQGRDDPFFDMDINDGWLHQLEIWLEYFESIGFKITNQKHPVNLINDKDLSNMGFPNLSNN